MGRPLEYNKQELDFIEKNLKIFNWEEVHRLFNENFGTRRTLAALQNSYYRNRSRTLDKSDAVDLVETKMKQAYRQLSNNSVLRKENKIVLGNSIFFEDVLAEMSAYVSSIHPTPKKVKPKKENKNKEKKRKLTMEIMLSDLHYGKLTDKFNAVEARKRMSKMLEVTLREILVSNTDEYYVDKIILALMGDIIESDIIHGAESVKGCEMTTSEQIVLATQSLFEDFIQPLAETGLRIEIPCVTGNHDRPDKDKTCNKIGRSHFTFIIYSQLENLCKAFGYSNVTFEIADDVFIVKDIYGTKVLYEHGDRVKGFSKAALEAHIARRSRQLNDIVNCIRLGHVHEYQVIDQGKVVINGCMCGQDDYATVMGYYTQGAIQTINYYIETKTRPTSFYKSFPAFLGF